MVSLALFPLQCHLWDPSLANSQKNYLGLGRASPVSGALMLNFWPDWRQSEFASIRHIGHTLPRVDLLDKKDPSDPCPIASITKAHILVSRLPTLLLGQGQGVGFYFTFQCVSSFQSTVLQRYITSFTSCLFIEESRKDRKLAHALPLVSISRGIPSSLGAYVFLFWKT